MPYRSGWAIVGLILLAALPASAQSRGGSAREGASGLYGGASRPLYNLPGVYNENGPAGGAALYGARDAGGFGVNRATPGFGVTRATPGFGVNRQTPGFGVTRQTPGFGVTRDTPGFGVTRDTPGFGGNRSYGQGGNGVEHRPRGGIGRDAANGGVDYVPQPGVDLPGGGGAGLGGQRISIY